MNEQTSHIKDKQRILRGHKLRRAVIGDSVGLLVPPLVAALRPRNFISSTLENEDVLNVSAALECRVEDSLGGNSFPTAAPFVRGKDDAALAVVKPCGAAATVIVVTSSHPCGHVVATRHCHRAIVVAVGGWAVVGPGGGGRPRICREGGW